MRIELHQSYDIVAQDAPESIDDASPKSGAM